MKLLNFLKEWTLPVAMVMGTLIYFIFALTPSLDGAAEFFGRRARRDGEKVE